MQERGANLAKQMLCILLMPSSILTYKINSKIYPMIKTKHNSKLSRIIFTGLQISPNLSINVIPIVHIFQN